MIGFRDQDRQFAKRQLNSRALDLEKMLKSVKQAAEALERDDFVYVVVLDSLWADYGELSAAGSGEDLEEAVRDAEEKFRRLNKRSDIQARKSYAMRFPNGMEISLLVEKEPEDRIP